jgi:hypothetical protein
MKRLVWALILLALTASACATQSQGGSISQSPQTEQSGGGYGKGGY